jgi:TonB-linked SusC/RagA family outer membrane protein
MKTKLNGILTLLLVLVVQVAFAQQSVTGKVTDISGEGLFGVTVQIKGTNTGVTTDFDGNFTLNAAGDNTLVFSFTGYLPQEVKVAGQRTLNVQMAPSNLEAVIVQGYRTVNSKTSNVAASIVSSEDIENRPNASFIQRIAGQVAGLNIQTGSGQPGANSRIQLRGPSSANGNSEPLILLDGIPINEDDFSTLNPNDIDTFVTLKDAAGTAIYGNRGANGVIVITTRRGKTNSPLKVQYQATSGFSELLPNDYDIYDARGYLALENRAGTGLGSTLTPGEIAAFGVNTVWSDVFFRSGITNQHNISFTQGGSNTSTFTSINYTEQQGALQASGLQRFNIRSNLNGSSDNKKFRYSTQLQLGYSNSDSPGAIGSGALFGNYILGAFQSLPYFDPATYNNDLLSVPTSETFQNTPFYLMDGLNYVSNEINSTKLVGGVNAEYDVAKNLTLKYTIGADFTGNQSLSYRDPNGALERSDVIQGLAGGVQSESYSTDLRLNSQLGLNYNAKLDKEGKHSLTALAYMEYVKSHFKTFGYTQNGLDPRTAAAGDGSSFIGDTPDNDIFVPSVNANKLEYGLFSYFGLADYDYDQRFGFSATVRRDASSRFTSANRWGTFYSVAGRWNIEEESFMEGSVFNGLKLRASYGTAGNDRLVDSYYGALTNTRSLFQTGLGYGGNQTFVPSQFANPDLTWETVATANIGIDFLVMNSRIRGSLEFYNKKTTDLFFETLISGSTGAGFEQLANSGDMVNRGIELGLNYDLIRSKTKGGFNLEVFGNVAYNDNEVTFVNIEGGFQDNGGTAIGEGFALNSFFRIPYVGVNPANGNLLFLDINGNLTENPTQDDRRINGDEIANFQGGFGFNIDYKGFFLQSQWNFTTGRDQMDFDLSSFQNPAFIGRLNLSTDLDRAWTTPGQITDIPSLTAGNAATANIDRYQRNSDFLRLRFLQVGYNLPKALTDATFITNGRIFVSGENLLTFTEWRGNDPERPDLATQFDYPNSRIFSVGIDLTF